MIAKEAIHPPLTLVKADSVFSGISTFGRLPYYPCLASDDVKFDIAFIGIAPIPDRTGVANSPVDRYIDLTASS